MDRAVEDDVRLLLIDTCGDVAGVVLSAGQVVVAAEDFARGSASAEILPAVRRILMQVGWRLAELHAIGVVSGPGSFTGVRAGLAAAKGLCEAAGLRMAAVSRLKVLADKALERAGFAALDAGRGELYVRDILSGREWLCTSDELMGMAGKDLRIVVAEQRIAERLLGCHTVVRPLHVSDALSAVERRLRAGGNDVSLTDGNYVREERDIYRRPGHEAKDLKVQT